MGRLQEAVDAIRSGDKERGKRLLAHIVHEDPQNEQAWMWLAQTVDDPKQKRHCYQQVLKANPENRQAQDGLRELLAPSSVPPLVHSASPIPRKSTNFSALITIIIAVFSLGVGGIGGFVIRPFLLPVSGEPSQISAAEYPTYTPFPSLAPLPTYTPQATYTPQPGSAQIVITIVPTDIPPEPTVEPTKPTEPIGIIIVDTWKFEIMEVHSDPGKDASRQNVVVLGNLTNQGTKTDTFSAMFTIVLLDGKGREYEADSVASWAAEDKYDTESSAFVAPEDAAYIAIAYNVPADQHEFTLAPGSLVSSWSGNVSFTLP